MRVIAGIARSLPLKAPEGLDTRPTTDRIKETLFNILQGDIQGSVFVDLFSGSGAIGIEALSRGAKKAYFVDNSPKSIDCIQQNLVFTKLSDRAIVIKQDVFSALHSIYEKEIDILFMDPPYAGGYEPQVFEVLKSMRNITSDTLIVAEASLHTDFSFLDEMGFAVMKDKQYKTNRHLFIKRA